MHCSIVNYVGKRLAVGQLGLAKMHKKKPHGCGVSTGTGTGTGLPKPDRFHRGPSVVGRSTLIAPSPGKASEPLWSFGP